MKCTSRISAATLLLIAVAGCQPKLPELATVPFVPDSGNLFVRCGSLIDGISDEVMHDRMVVIRDGRFASIVDGTAEIRPGMNFLDLSDKTCLPGLINMHVHLLERAIDSVDYGVYFRNDSEVFHARVLEAAAMSLNTGFTTVRNVGDYLPEPIVFGREQIARGLAIGPRIQTGGPYLTIPDGGGEVPAVDYDPADRPAESRLGVARGPEEFREKARDAVAAGADFLKVIASGAVFAFGTEPGAPEMTQDEIEAVVEVAHAAGIKVTAHVHSAQSGRDAILAGVDSLEHASLLTDDVIALAAERGVVFSMDIYNGTYTDTVGREQGYPEEILKRNVDTTDAQREVFRKALAAGVTLVYGTDASVHPHDMGAWQFTYMVEFGMRPMQAVQSATSVAAQAMGWEKDVGAVEAGRYGDLIAVAGDPLADLLLMRDISVVIKGGLVFKNQEN